MRQEALQQSNPADHALAPAGAFALARGGEEVRAELSTGVGRYLAGQTLPSQSPKQLRRPVELTGTDPAAPRVGGWKAASSGLDPSETLQPVPASAAPGGSDLVLRDPAIPGALPAVDASGFPAERADSADATPLPQFPAQLVPAPAPVPPFALVSVPPAAAASDPGTAATLLQFDQADGTLTTAPTAAPPAPAPDITASVTASVTVSQNASGRIEVHLAPEELGRVRVEMTASGDRMLIHLAVERPESLDLLRRHGDQLLQEFRQAGIGGGSLTFGTWGQGEQHQRPSPAAPPPAQATPLSTDPLPSLAAQLRAQPVGSGLNLRL